MYFQVQGGVCHKLQQAKQKERRIDIIYKKIKTVLFLFVTVLLVSFPFCVFAELDIAHKIWKEMAEAGNIDLTTCWELMGMYTFGDTTGDGYVTLPMTEDGRQISESVSWRMYPKSEDDITERYFPMLMVLLSEFCEADELLDIADWLLTQEAVALLARYNGLPYQSDTNRFVNFNIYIKYNEEHNELYCLLNASRQTENLTLKQ